MATLNSFYGIGRLTRDPEVKNLANGNKVANFGLAINNKKKDPNTGEWIDDPCFLDCKAFNSQYGRKLADLVEQYLTKGKQVFIGGSLKMERWTGQDGSPRSAIRVYVDDIQLIDSSRANGDGQQPQAQNQQEQQPQQQSNSEDPPF